MSIAIKNEQQGPKDQLLEPMQTAQHQRPRLKMADVLKSKGAL